MATTFSAGGVVAVEGATTVGLGAGVAAFVWLGAGMAATVGLSEEVGVPGVGLGAAPGGLYRTKSRAGCQTVSR